MSYIDREAVIERLCYVCGADCDKNLCPVKQTVEYMPDADVEPVRHGEWIDMGDFEQCSACQGTHLKEVNTMYGKAIWIKSARCPNCGALMDGCG